MLLIVAAHAYYLVPTARFELAHLTALAPQASVSTNSTTSATVKKSLNLLGAARYFGAAPFGCGVPVAGCAGAEAGAAAGAAAGAGVVVGAAGGADAVASVPAPAGVDVGAVSPAAGASGAGIVCVTPGFVVLALSAFSPIVSRIVFGGAATARVPT